MNTPRTGFTLQLSTVLALALGIVALVWLNAQPRPGGIITDMALTATPQGSVLSPDLQYHDYRFTGYGWPFNEAWVEPLEHPEKDWDGQRAILYSFTQRGWQFKPLAFNVLLCLGLLALLGAAMEVAARIRLRLWPLDGGA